MSTERQYLVCRICSKTFDEDDSSSGVTHVRSEPYGSDGTDTVSSSANSTEDGHLLMDQLNALVYRGDNEYHTHVDDKVHESEYDARTYLMKEIPQAKRLDACLEECTKEKSEQYEGLLTEALS